MSIKELLNKLFSKPIHKVHTNVSPNNGGMPVAVVEIVFSVMLLSLLYMIFQILMAN